MVAEIRTEKAIVKIRKRIKEKATNCIVIAFPSSLFVKKVLGPNTEGEYQSIKRPYDKRAETNRTTGDKSKYIKDPP